MARKNQDSHVKRSPTSEEIKRRLEFTNTLLFETPGGTRYTLDSPILPNVWLAFAIDPRSQQELILTASNESNAGRAAKELRRMLGELRKKRPEVGDEGKKPEKRKRARVAYIPGQIAVKMYFDELMRVVLPLTPWWHETYDALKRCWYKYPETAADWEPFPRPDEEGKREQDLCDALMLMRREIDPTVAAMFVKKEMTEDEKARRIYIHEIPPSLIWLVRISGIFADCFATGTDLLADDDALSSKLNQDLASRKHDRIETFSERETRLEEQRLRLEQALQTREDIVKAFAHLYDGWPDVGEYPTERVIWRVTKNRRVTLAVAKSALTVKADAARKLFSISCRNITWAVLDSGIDRTHPAFRLTAEEHENQVRRKLARSAEAEGEVGDRLLEALESRVVKTLDFTYLRQLLDIDLEMDSEDSEAQEQREQLLNKIACRMSDAECSCSLGGDCDPAGGEPLKEAEALLGKLRQGIEEGREISWADLQDAIVSKNPPIPTNDHGTHVAGILGADWIEDFPGERDLPLAKRTRRMSGICPDINLIDVRVFRENGLTDEFELLAALQYLRWMNSRAGTMQVHGANLSLSLIHEVRRFACGQTPICDECNEASALGMVIVAAAGNRGFEMSDLEEVKASDSYKAVSITDPGNAESVITVGATHRKRPHEYGVSYFSSRGPTGDGRLKPDLVAPGEKIKGPTPNGRAEFKDGTSMAAPHVSGVAALLMARHNELIGQPERIKKILCETATDLGRERYFQGHGLVDALRAIQSV